jgi:nucleotide-binding universal stress UspA family protein
MRLQLDRILCATDLSELGNNAVAYGIALAKVFKAKLYLCHVVDLSSTTMYGEASFAFEAQNLYMEDYAQGQLNDLVGEHEIEWEPLVTTGRASDEIVRLAEENNIDLVITATRGRSGFKRFILGSVTEHLMKTLPCPLMSLRGSVYEKTLAVDQGIGLKKILVAVDFSPDSDHAYEYGVSLAQEFQSDLHLVHVIAPPLYKNLPKALLEERERLQTDLRKTLNEKLKEIIPGEAFNWCAPKTVLLAGQPYEELSKYAVVQDIDLIVLGVRGHGMVESLFVGSTTERVVRRAICPVLCVRPKIADA